MQKRQLTKGLLWAVGCFFQTLLAGQQTDVVGDLSPIVLTGDTTEWPLLDFFTDPKRIERIACAAELTATLSPDKRTLRLVQGKNLPFFSNLDFILRGGKRISVVVKAAQKQQIVLQLADEGYTQVAVKGDMNGWNPQQGRMVRDSNGWYYRFSANPGRYEYQFIADGIALKDPKNEVVSANGRNSVLIVAEAAATLRPHLYTLSADERQVFIGYTQTPQRVLAYWNNKWIPTSTHTYSEKGHFVGQQFSLNLPYDARALKRSAIRVYAYNAYGEANDLLIPLEYGAVVRDPQLLDRSDYQTQIMYFALIDRFNNGDKKNDNPIKDKRVVPLANWQGGDLEGVTQKIKDGYFNRLNINSLWLSPITRNPDSAFQEYPAPHRWYSGYHGYWPVSLSQIDPHFGSDRDLHNLVQAAHKARTNVFLDYVSHHVHTEHPLYRQHPNWITDLTLANGQKNIRLWDEQRLSTWFDIFLPTLDLSKPEVIQATADSALFWIDKFDLDGFRHDAAKHVPLAFWQALSQKIRKNHTSLGKPIFQIGETYGARDLIQPYVRTGLMDAQFDFPLYFDARDAFGQDSTPLHLLAESLSRSLTYFGHHNTMGNITGNHDQARFISLAGGGVRWDEDQREAGFKRKIGVGKPIGYARLQMLTAFMMAIPGVPVFYYGDEIGLPGAGDPDNRRPMKFERLQKLEAETLAKAQKISSLRRQRLSLQYGDTRILSADKHSLVLLRQYFGEMTIAMFNKSTQTQTVTFDWPEAHRGVVFKSHFGATVAPQEGRLSVTIAPLSFDFLTH